MTDTAADRIIGLYQRHAAAFDRDRSKSLFERIWLDRFVELAGERADLLDIGCGAGDPIARYLIDRGHALIGVDSSPALLALARERFPEQGWIEADMRRLALGRRFGGLIAWNSLFHLDAGDQRAMFPILAKHARPGAAVMFTSGSAAGEAIGTFEGRPLFHASLDRTEYRALLDQAGFTVIDHAIEDASCGGATIWLARRNGSDNALIAAESKR